MIFAGTKLITKEQAEALTKLALEIEQYEIDQATDEMKDQAADIAQLHRQGMFKLINAAYDERK